jgi:hypothetical protein
MTALLTAMIENDDAVLAAVADVDRLDVAGATLEQRRAALERSLTALDERAGLALASQTIDRAGDGDVDELECEQLALVIELRNAGRALDRLVREHADAQTALEEARAAARRRAAETLRGELREIGAAARPHLSDLIAALRPVREKAHALAAATVSSRDPQGRGDLWVRSELLAELAAVLPLADGDLERPFLRTLFVSQEEPEHAHARD